MPGRLLRFQPYLSVGILCLFSAGLLLSWQAATPAQSTAQLEARLARIESENTMLRSRISRLENSITRLSRGGGTLSEAPTIDPPSSIGSGLADDPVFKRLATLVIELRERIIAVEERLAGRSTTPQ
jgi:hypothetical protein